MTAIFWGNETCQSAPHVQHFAKNITHTLECQCKKKDTQKSKKLLNYLYSKQKMSYILHYRAITSSF
jgi:hypothetical protein